MFPLCMLSHMIEDTDARAVDYLESGIFRQAGLLSSSPECSKVPSVAQNILPRCARFSPTLSTPRARIQMQ